ncbi:MAG: hypothetical protein COU35_03190 [Candidatus Magasanikbacteria bacterium CG10_big_fil_rev_8_21_14_0_10_47_10]|uniref:HAD family hydrolase n=1 Tax=Candidatus Magasanikbacteria bacterium CG10_big_fil_rev_8_21_14_0_10_47_10 TaxID=1974652 RepID=A0A2H0TQ54_9BACT|nr:MAG: hypothetical protein COU35_03190 [Candidatus Magasanikbacteria bacterium CG10_big_fil_rev_8_21_14_0_10_47_10]
MKPKHDRLIIMDFDHTMFNTTTFVAALKKEFQEQFGIDEATFAKYRDHIKKCNKVIDIDRFVEHIPHTDKTGMHETIRDLLHRCADKWIFDDVREFMNRHQDRFDIAVVTNGDIELQSAKIHNSKLPGSFHTDISTDPKQEVVARLIAPYKKIYFIDDKPRTIEAVKKAHPTVLTYFMTRDEDHPYKDDCPSCRGADYAVAGLTFDIP